MSNYLEKIKIGAFACEYGDLKRSPESIEDFTNLCSSLKIDSHFNLLGCGSFWQMTKPVEFYIARSIEKTLAESNIAADRVDRIVFSTTDSVMQDINTQLAAHILEKLNLVNCVPIFISMQQCASSMAALDHAHYLFENNNVNNVIVVSIDYIVEESKRITPYALFGDAVASCMVSRGDNAGFSLMSYSVNLDFSGLVGKDDFNSRKAVAKKCLDEVLSVHHLSMDNVEKYFSTNLFKPLALFNSATFGVSKSKLYIETLFDRAHCGNSDWMINLIDYLDSVGIQRGKYYLIQSSAPGFFSCALIKSL